MANPITTKIGDVSAYLDAVAHGFEGTRAEFGELLANSANYAQSAESAASAASASATTATAKAGEAATAATAAQTAKTQTEQSASQALTDIAAARSGAISAVQTEGQSQTANARAQAQAATQSATTASTKASEASASATTATTKATEAAASATNAASSASAAQDVLDSIPADYSDLSANVSQLQADLDNLDDDVNDLNNKISLSKEIEYVTKSTGYVNTNGNIVDSGNYAMTFPIFLRKGTLVIDAYATTPVSILSKSNEAGTEFTSLVAADSSSQYTYTISEEGYYVFSYRLSHNLAITQTFDIKTVVGILQDLQDDIDILDNGNLAPSPNIEFVNGYISDIDLRIHESNTYKYSKPFFMLPGKISVVCAGRSMAVLSKTNKNGSFYELLIAGEDAAAKKKYTYTLTEGGYYALCYKTEYGIDVNVNGNILAWAESANEPSSNAEKNAIEIFKQSDITTNYSIKAFKTLNYSDDTTPKYSQVLWQDTVNDSYYVSSNAYSQRYHIFDWDSSLASGSDSSYYQAMILPNGDILFVFQTQFVNMDDSSAEGAYRRNPIIYSASNNFAPSIIDFGSSLKPCGWLQNIGALYSYTHDRLYIAEYTRSNEKYAHIWAVDIPVTDVSNWHIVLEKEVIHPYESGFKHFHSCQEDPFTNILYFSSGDNDLSSAVWYSTDGGDTLVQLDSYNAGKYRLLNMAFTKDYVYWASDQWNPNHFLWRIARNQSTGILDVSTLTKLITFDDEVVNGISRIATYTTVFMPCFNCIVMLDRDDSGIHSAVPVRLYDIESGNLYTIANMLPISAGVPTGFRNVTVTCYVKSNEIVCSFDKRLLNYNKLLGNNSESRINNLVLRIYKNGSSFAVDFDTVY